MISNPPASRSILESVRSEQMERRRVHLRVHVRIYLELRIRDWETVGNRRSNSCNPIASMIVALLQPCIHARYELIYPFGYRITYSSTHVIMFICAIRLQRKTAKRHRARDIRLGTVLTSLAMYVTYICVCVCVCVRARARLCARRVTRLHF